MFYNVEDYSAQFPGKTDSIIARDNVLLLLFGQASLAIESMRFPSRLFERIGADVRLRDLPGVGGKEIYYARSPVCTGSGFLTLFINLIDFRLSPCNAPDVFGLKTGAYTGIDSQPPPRRILALALDRNP